jgi:DNA-binding MarR family transcriptional regulator
MKVLDGPLDHETRVDSDDHGALRLWLRLLTCSQLIETQVRGRLRSEFDCTLPRFDLVAQLDRHPEGLKMGELSRRLMVTGGNITGITDQLEADGWVERTDVENDRRAWLVRLTPRGKKAFRQMAAVHERWIVDLFAEASPRDLEQLFRLLGKLKQALRVATAAPDKERA